MRATFDERQGRDTWSDPDSNAGRILQLRYLLRDDHGRLIESPDGMLHRVARATAAAETLYGRRGEFSQALAEQFYEVMANREFLPNSPTLMNAGRGSGTLSACFVLDVKDSIDSIFQSVYYAALIQKAGGGTGYNFSDLRPAGDMVASSSGIASGPISFMRVFSAGTEAIQQGTHRRGANIGILDVNHPDIAPFIDLKRDVKELTNFNLSVAMPDDFVIAVRRNPLAVHMVRNPRNGACYPIRKNDGSFYTVGDIMSLIVVRAWESGEPGVIFIDRVNAANPTPRLGRIRALNPCTEQALLSYESCNLGSINLLRLVRLTNGAAHLDFERLAIVIRLAVRFLDNIIDINHYPLPQIEKITKGNRKIGLGIMGFAEMLFALGIPYDSEEGVAFGEKVMRFMNETSHAASRDLAQERGVFPNWPGSVWEQKGIRMRNACTSTVAPTGSISILAGCSSGIEPLYSLAYHRNILGGQTFQEMNDLFVAVARSRGFFSPGLMETIAKRGSLQDVHGIPADVRRVFVTTYDIAPEWHLRMQAAFQRSCDAGIAKTINMPASATVTDVRNAMLRAHELGCKGVTVYRNGSRPNQPMSLVPDQGGERDQEQCQVDPEPQLLVGPPARCPSCVL